MNKNGHENWAEWKKRLAGFDVVASDDIQRLRAEIERKDKLIEQIGEILVNELDPGEWNDGCGCCGTRLLEQTEEWKSLIAALEAAERE